MRPVVAVVVTLVVVLAAVVAESFAAPVDHRPAFALPEAGGQGAAVTLPDGQPVLVVHAEDGTVTVAHGVAPHSGEPLAWCPRSQIFVEPIGAARFDAEGRYAFGPAPAGLVTFDADVVGDVVRVGARREPLPRWVAPAHPVGIARDDGCVNSEGLRGGTAHDWTKLPLANSPAEVPPATGTYRVEGAVIRLPSSGPQLCGRGSLSGCRVLRADAVSGLGIGTRWFGRIEGELLVRRAPGGALTDVVARLAHTTSTAPRLPQPERTSAVVEVQQVRQDGDSWVAAVHQPEHFVLLGEHRDCVDAPLVPVRTGQLRLSEAPRIIYEHLLRALSGVPPRDDATLDDAQRQRSPDELDDLARREPPVVVHACLADGVAEVLNVISTGKAQ